MKRNNNTRQKQNLLKVSWQRLQNLVKYNGELKTIRRQYGVPLTNAGESVKVAMDAALETSGHFTTIRNAVASGGIDTYPQFLGYAYLSGLQQNGFIRAGVEGLADDMTARFIELIRTSDIENNDDDKINKINEYLNAFQIKELFNKAAALCGYFGGCLIYVDTDDEDLLSALDEKSLNHSIKGYVLIEPINIYPGRYNSTNPLRADYFIPETWFVLGQEVHASRLLYLAADEVNMLLKPAYNFFGIAPAQIAADSVSHFIKDREAASRLLHKYSLLVFKTDMGSALYSGNPEELYSRVKVLADFRDNNSVIIIDKEDEDIVTVTTSLAGVTDVVRLSLELMPIMFRQPLTKFLGISPGGMNATGESDENNWNEYVLSQCEKIFRKPVKRLLELIQYDLFGEVDECIDFIFQVQSSNDEVKEINNNKIKADTYVQLTTAGIISPEEARKALAEDEKSGFNSIDVDAVPEVPETGNEDLFSAFDEWKEEDHDRDENGRFTSSSSSKTANKKDKLKEKEEMEDKAREAQLNFYKKSTDTVNEVLNTISDLRKENLEVVPWKNRLGQTSIYVKYLGSEIRISDHNKNMNFDTSDYHIRLDDSNNFKQVREELPKVITKINQRVDEQTNMRNEKINKYEEQRKKDVSEIKNKRAKELPEIKNQTKEYMKNFENHPYRKEIEDLVDIYISMIILMWRITLVMNGKILINCKLLLDFLMQNKEINT